MIPDLTNMSCVTVEVPLVIYTAVSNVMATLGVTLVTHNTNQGAKILITDALCSGVIKSGQDLISPVANIESVEPYNSEKAPPHLITPNSHGNLFLGYHRSFSPRARQI